MDETIADEIKNHPLVQHVDDERKAGKGIRITLKKGSYFYDDCSVMEFLTWVGAGRAVMRLTA